MQKKINWNRIHVIDKIDLVIEIFVNAVLRECNIGVDTVYFSKTRFMK